MLLTTRLVARCVGIAICLGAFTGCLNQVRYDNKVSAAVNPSFRSIDTKTRSHLILPFTVTDPEYQTAYAAPAKASTQKLLAEWFESSMIQAGYSLVDRSRLPDVLKELALAETGLTQDSGLHIGQLMSAQVVVFGVVPIARNKAGNQSGSTVYSLKAVDVETSAIIWKLDLNCARSGDMRANSALYAQESSESCFKEGLAALSPK